MRALSKQRLSKMHAMLDKQLENQDQIKSNPSFIQRNKRQKNDFNHLRYTSNLDLNQSDSAISNPKQQSSQRPSLFRRSIEKISKQKQKLQPPKKTYGDLSSSESSDSQKDTRNSLKASRKNEINQLQKKLLDLQKKMQNIGLSSSEEEDERLENKKAQSMKLLNKVESKKSLNGLKLQQNNFSSSHNDYQPSSSRNEGTARFSGTKRIEQINKKEKIEFKSSLPLSHRNNSKEKQSSSDSNEQFDLKYEKFVKIQRGSQKALEKQHKKNQSNPSSQQQDSSDQVQKRQLYSKSITEQIQRLSIMKKQSLSLASNKQPQQKPFVKNVQPKIQKVQKAKINTFQNVPQRKTTVQHQTLQPKYSLQRKKKSKSQSKKSINIPKNNLSKEKVLSKKSSNQGLIQKSLSKKSIQRNYTNYNLDNSFRSDNSAKSKKSLNSLRSVGSNKSLKSQGIKNVQPIQNLQQKKLNKKISNLQKELQHYKRLSKKYQTQLSEYKLMQIQYRKLEIQFKKSEQIRIQQKKIIQNFRNKTLNI